MSKSLPNDNLQRWIEEIRGGDARSIARAISAVENREPQAQELLRLIFPHTGKAAIVGVTGAPGAGKSTLVDGLAGLLRARKHTVGILAVDPSSPFTGGAILGDRVRMQARSTDPGIYIRSMATRGSLGGLAAATFDAALLLDAAGKDFILVETVGVGQDEVDVMRLADVTLVVVVPGMGDEVQVFKAGILEIADIFVLNKSDLSGADRIEAAIRGWLDLAPPTKPWRPPIVRTVATRRKGLEDLLGAITQYLAVSRNQGTFEQRQREHWRERIVAILRERILRHVLKEILANGTLDQYAAAVATRREDPYSLAEKLLEQAGNRELKQSGKSK